MPELPEVETVRLQLLHHVVGLTIQSVEVFHEKTVGRDLESIELLVGHTIEYIDRVGKLMIFSFTDESDLFVLSHLKMTGQFFYVADGSVEGGGHSMTSSDTAELPGRHTRVALYFTDGSALYFNDMRLFGYFKVANAATVAIERAKYGPEPIDEQFDTDEFVALVRKRKTPIKAALLDQSLTAGLGNIYVDEALWRAQVRPTRKANRLTKAEAAAVITQGGEVMRQSIAVGGTTFQHFVDTGGQNGNFTDYLKVFGMQGTPCERCGTTIKKIRCAGRGTHYCPGCQK
jgi:formamidopyrimidine-DNA glycosylase